MTELEINELKESLESTKKQLKEAESLNIDKDIKIKWLEEQNKLLLERLFGRKSEKTDALEKKHPNLFNFEIFNEAEDQAKVMPEPKLDDETVEVSFKAKKRNLNNRLKNVEEVVIYHDLENKTCDTCGNEMVYIGESEPTIKIVYVPAKLKLEKHIYRSYKCVNCSNDKAKIVSPENELAFPKSMASSSMVAHLITEKFLKHVPLYRQEKLFRNSGVDMSRVTLSNWFLAGANYLKPLFELMHKDLLKQDIIHMDETTVKVIENDHNTSYVWGLSSSKHAVPILLYFFKETRAHRNAIDLLGGFKGYVQSDCYEAYARIPSVTNVCCLAHARRKYAEILKACEKRNTMFVENAASQGVKFIDKLYKIEHELETSNASIDEIFKVRNEKSKAILDEYKNWLDKEYSTYPATSAIGKAMFYSINNFERLSNYLKDGRLTIDNNRAERQMKSFVIGRKNFLFCFTDRGANGSTIAYSIVETAIANKLNVFEYLTYVFDEAAKLDPKDIDGYRKLLPYSDSLPNSIKVQKPE